MKKETTNQIKKAEILEALKEADTGAMTNSRLQYSVVIYEDGEVDVREQINGDSFRIVDGAETVKTFAYREDVSSRKAKATAAEKFENGEYEEIYHMWNDYKA